MIDSGLSARRTIPAHPMGIVQQRPRGDLWTHADWYAAEWLRIRLARMIQREFAAAKERESRRPKER